MYVRMFVVAARPIVILIVCTKKKRASKKERKKERKKNDKRVHIHIAIQYIGQPRPMADIHAYREHHLVKR